jgi:hypothetical protein
MECVRRQNFDGAGRGLGLQAEERQTMAIEDR